MQTQSYKVSGKMQGKANAICATVVMHCYSGNNDRLDTDEEKKFMHERALAFINKEMEAFADEFALDSSEDERNKVKEYLRRKILSTELDGGLIMFNKVKNDLIT